MWIGGARSDVSALPPPVKASFGHRLNEVQNGRMPLDTKPLPRFGAGVLGLRERYDGNAYRLMGCRGSSEGGLRAACLHEEVEVRHRPVEAGCGINRDTAQAGASIG